MRESVHILPGEENTQSQPWKENKDYSQNLRNTVVTIYSYFLRKQIPHACAQKNALEEKT